LHDWIGREEASIFALFAFQWRFAGLEFDLHLVTPQYFILFIQNGDLFNTLWKMDNGSITSGYQSPFGTKMRVQDKDSLAVRIRTDIELFNQWVMIGQWTFQSQGFTGHASNLLFFCSILLIRRILNGFTN